jgi:hypothetical protein
MAAVEEKVFDFYIALSQKCVNDGLQSVLEIRIMLDLGLLVKF